MSVMLRNQLNLMQVWNWRGTYRTQHLELLELFQQSRDSPCHAYSSAGLCCPVDSGCCFWPAAAVAVVAVDSAAVHCSSDSRKSAHCTWDNYWHNVQIHHIWNSHWVELDCCCGLVLLMCCSNDSVADWECAASAGWKVVVVAVSAGTTGSTDNFHLVLQNEMENPGKSCSGGGYCC